MYFMIAYYNITFYIKQLLYEMYLYEHLQMYLYFFLKKIIYYIYNSH